MWRVRCLDTYTRDALGHPPDGWLGHFESPVPLCFTFLSWVSAYHGAADLSSGQVLYPFLRYRKDLRDVLGGARFLVTMSASAEYVRSLRPITVVYYRGSEVCHRATISRYPDMPQRSFWMAIALRVPEVFRRRPEEVFVYDPVTGWVFYPVIGCKVNWLADGADVVAIIGITGHVLAGGWIMP